MASKVIKGPWPKAGSRGDETESTSFVFKAMWNEMLMNYRETLTTAQNLSSKLHSVINRLALGRMEVDEAIERLEKLCTDECSVLLGDELFLLEMSGGTLPSPVEGRERSTADEDSGDLPTDEPTPRRRVH